MNIIVTESYEEMSKKTADIFEREVRNNPSLVLGLATGSTPIGTYRELVRRHKEEELDFSSVRSFNLDEYIGLEPENTSSYTYYMYEQLFNHINIDKKNVRIPDGMTEDPVRYGEKYDQLIREAGGIDILLLGIGTNGHIAFMEPDEELSVDSGVVELTKQTIKDNSRFFESKKHVPTQAISMGMGSILRAKKIVMIVSGKVKAPIIGEILNNGRVTTKIPATFLLLHNDVTWICDKEAYSRVTI